MMTKLDPKDVLRSADGLTPPVSYSLDEHGRIGVYLGMSRQAFQDLIDLAESSGTPLEEIIGKAFLLYKCAAEAHRDGKAVGIAESAEVLETEFVGL